MKETLGASLLTEVLFVPIVYILDVLIVSRLARSTSSGS
jgi:hypothetical protein